MFIRIRPWTGALLTVSCLGSLAVGPALFATSDVWEASLLESDSDWPMVYPNDVNESGRISGFWSDGTAMRAIVWASPSSSPVELESLAGDTVTWAADINGNGTICGTSGGSYPVGRAVTWDNQGIIHDRQPADWDHSDLWSLNEAGAGVGSVWDDAGHPYPYTYACYWPRNGDPSVLDMGTGYFTTWAISINKDGVIAGQAYPEASGLPYVRACYWDGPDGELVDIHDAIEDAVGEELYVSLGYEATDDGAIVGWCHTADDFQLISFVYTESGGVTLLDDGGTGNAFAWQSAGKYLTGGLGGDPGFYGTNSAAIWERATSRGATTWTLHEIESLDGYEMIGVGVNKSGAVVGAAMDADGNTRAWYARRSGR